MCERYIDRLPTTQPQLGTWPTNQACTLTGNPNSDPSVHSPALNPLSHTSQGNNIFLNYDKVGKEEELLEEQIEGPDVE